MEKDKLFKVVLLGDSCVGKTNFIRSLCATAPVNIVPQDGEGYKSTQVEKYTVKISLNTRDCVIDIYDVGNPLIF
jgi:signal recognition particle receptor subunit beta